MTRIIIMITSLILAVALHGNASTSDSTEVFLLTCLPGKTVVTVYGHSAIRIVKKSTGFDKVYSWGVYDFSTPHFAWKFAQGRLKYLLEEVSYENFLQQYLIEKRNVLSQRINLNKTEVEILLNLININMLPENRLYLYDFFYDNCATRIRDIIERTLSQRIIYPLEEEAGEQTFRKRLNEAQSPLPWLSFGTDLLIGMKGDMKAGFRERMFLPEDLQKNLSLAQIRRKEEAILLLEKPILLLDFEKLTSAPAAKQTPIIYSSLLFLIVILLSIFFKSRKMANYIDMILFFSFSLLSILLLFFGFFTDHQVMRMNINLIWLNPFLIFALIALFIKKWSNFWFKIEFIISTVFLLTIPLFPQSINLTMLPLIIILAMRSGMRGWYFGYWN